MEDLDVLLLVYFQSLVTWWWLTLTAASFFGLIACILMSSDYTLTTSKAISLAFVGVVNIIPVVRKLTPKLVVNDFHMRWAATSAGYATSFKVSACLLLYLSFVLAPLIFPTVLINLAWDSFLDSELGTEMREGGIGNTIKRRLRG